jgi:hypothetical protein
MQVIFSLERGEWKQSGVDHGGWSGGISQITFGNNGTL